MEQVLELTQELVPGKIRIDDAEDPEIPGDRYHVFEVTADYASNTLRMQVFDKG